MYMYAKGTKNAHTNPTGTMVQIVKGELRKIGDWTTYSAAPLDELADDDKYFVGWYWYNTNKETRYWMEDETLLALKGEKAELFDQLHRIYKEDRIFFTRIIEKLQKVGLYMFEEEIKLRQDVFDHTPREAKYVIYDNDDYGRVYGEPRGTAVITTTGDKRGDEGTAIKTWIAETNGKPYEECLGVGFYTAVIYDEYADKRDAHLADLENKLNAARDAAVWGPI